MNILQYLSAYGLHPSYELTYLEIFDDLVSGQVKKRKSTKKKKTK